MDIRQILQGKWLGHPLHPALVHLPTALWPAALIFDILSRFASEAQTASALARTSFYCILLGLLVALAAVPTGLADWTEIKQEKPAWKLGLYHMMLNLSVAILWAINLGLRIGTLHAAVPVLPLILSLFATLLLATSGYLGGLMVYDYGTGVARMSKNKWRRIAQRGGAHLPEEPSS